MVVGLQVMSKSRPTILLSKMTFCGPFFGSRHSTCANITEGGLWRWGGKISEDFYVFVLLYNIKFMNKYKFDIF